MGFAPLQAILISPRYFYSSRSLVSEFLSYFSYSAFKRHYAAQLGMAYDHSLLESSGSRLISPR